MMIPLGFIIIGMCIGLAIGIPIMAYINIKDIKEVERIGLDALRETQKMDAAKLSEAYKEIERLNDALNKVQIEKATKAARIVGKAMKCPEVIPEWLKVFNESLPLPEGDTSDFGGITL